MGSNKQIEGIYPREASILISFQWEGRRHRERIALRPTTANLKAAERLRDEVVSAIKIGKFTLTDYERHFPDSSWLKKNHTVGGNTLEGLYESWIVIVEQELQETTLKEYRNVMQKHFLPAFGKKPVADITYEALAVHLAAARIKSAKTFNNIMTPLRRLFAFALKTGKVQHDVTRDIPSRKNQKPGPDPLEVPEIEIILQHMREKMDEQWLNYFEFAFFSGLRPSELIALTWDKVDFRAGKVRVDAARVRAIDKGAKTHKSRDVDLQTRALAALNRQKKYTFMKGGHVFNNPHTNDRFHDTGKPVRLAWRPALKAAGIRDRDAKQTRHSFATMCLHAGINPAYVARQMGHANARMFFEVYSKWIDGSANDRERAKLDALFGSGSVEKAL